MDPYSQSGSQGGSSSKGSTPDVRGKGHDILDGLHPRIETRGQSRRHDKKKDSGKKKGSKKSVVTKDPTAGPSNESAQTDSPVVDDVSARSRLPGSDDDGDNDNEKGDTVNDDAEECGLVTDIEPTKTRAASQAPGDERANDDQSRTQVRTDDTQASPEA